jgi:hypothetical protein
MNEGFADPRLVLRLVPICGEPAELLAVASDGLWKYTNEVSIGEERVAKPVALHLELIGPNPFREQIHFNLAVGRGESATGWIYDLEGRLIRTLFDSVLDTGVAEFAWDGRSDLGTHVRSGTYVLAIHSSSSRIVRRIVRVR